MLDDRQIEFAVVGGYLLVLVAVALVFQRFNENASDYFRSGCKGKWWLVGMSAFMTTFSAHTFTGAAGIAFIGGWSVLVIYFANVFSFVLNGLFLARWFRQLRATSAPEIIAMRFGVSTQQFYGWVMVVMQTIMSSLHLYGLCIFCAAVFGYDLKVLILVIGLVVVFQSLIGGNWAATATDFIQSMILMPMTVLISIICLIKLGGVSGMFSLIQAQGLGGDYQLFKNPDPRFGYQFTIAWSLAIFIKNSMVFNSMSQAPRYFSVKDGSEASKAAFLAAGLSAIGCIFWFIPPMTARLLFSEQVLGTEIAKPAEAAYAVASMQLLPLGMTGMMVVAMFSATMSSMDSGLNRNAAIFTNDIYPRLSRLLPWRRVEGVGLLRMGQIFTLVMGLLIVATSLYFANQQGRGVFEHMLTVSSILGVPMTTPLVLGLFFRRTPWWAALLSIACAAVPSTLGVLSGKGVWAGSENAVVLALGLDQPWLFQKQVIVNLAIGAGAFGASAVFWGRTSAEHRERITDFFHRMRTPVDFAREVGRGNDQTQARVVGWFCVVIGVAVAFLMALPNPWGWDGRGGIFFVAASSVAVGALLIASARNRRGDSRPLVTEPSIVEDTGARLEGSAVKPAGK